MATATATRSRVDSLNDNVTQFASTVEQHYVDCPRCGMFEADMVWCSTGWSMVDWFSCLSQAGKALRQAGVVTSFHHRAR